jgi:hypothetical protein
MVQKTTPDGIEKWQTTDDLLPSKMSARLADSTQRALAKRERFDFVWANSGERTGQTGMVQGSRGYQIDTETDYVYDNSAWQIVRAHAEYTAGGTSVPTTTLTMAGTLTYVSANSTSTTITTAVSSGTFQVNFPGIYAYHALVWINSGTFASRTFAEGLYNGATFVRNNGVATETMVNLTFPNVRVLDAGDTIGLRIWQNGSALTFFSRISVTRLG